MKNQLRIAYFGTPEWSALILKKLIDNDIIPSLIITNPDKPKSRGMILTPSPVKQVAEHYNIETITPEKITDEIKDVLLNQTWDMFIVVAYGKILPKWLLDIPLKGALNVHFSLLPEFRGASPVEYQVKSASQKVGISIMLIDEELDHGPILAQESFPLPWPLPSTSELGTILVQKGGELLVTTTSLWAQGVITPIEQDHTQATFTRKFSKKQGELDLTHEDWSLFTTIKALNPRPGTYFFVPKANKTNNNEHTRIVVKDAEWIIHPSQQHIPNTFTPELIQQGHLRITTIIPEGKKPIHLKDFLTHNPHLTSLLGRFTK